MVSGAAILAMVVTLMVCVLFPIILLIVLLIKSSHRINDLIGFSVGTLGFFVPQILIRIPILGFGGVQSALQGMPFFLNALVLAFTAGLFETAGRLGVFSILPKRMRSWDFGVAAGIGHGGTEAILLIGMTYVNNLLFSYTINSGFTDSLLSSGVTQEQLGQIMTALTTTPVSSFYMAGVERVFTILFHISMSVLLLQFMMNHKIWQGFALVTGIHTFVDFVTAILGHYGMNMFVIEGVIALFGIAAVFYTWYARRWFEPETDLI